MKTCEKKMNETKKSDGPQMECMCLIVFHSIGEKLEPTKIWKRVSMAAPTASNEGQ